MILKNPTYIQLLKLGKSTRFCPQEVEIPILQSKTLTAPNRTTIALYKEQLRVYNEIKDKTSCLLEAKMSFGKTILSIALHQAWGGSTLIVVHTLKMAYQFTSEFQKFTEISPTMYCDGKKEISDVTITTATTFRKKYKEWNFDNLVIDESDIFFSIKSIKATVEMKAIRKIGLTGTVGTIYDMCNNIDGGVLAKFYGSHVKAKYDESKNPLTAIYYHKYEKTYKEEKEKIKAYEWHKFRSYLDADVERKKEQIKYIMKNHKDGSSLVLFDRVADVDAFYNAGIKRGLKCYKNHGKLVKKEREKMLNDFIEKGGILFGQTSILNRGYNNVKLNRVFIFYPVRKENTIQQIIGRVMRYMDNKKSFVYLWVDSELEFQFKKQKIIIKKFFNMDVC